MMVAFSPVAFRHGGSPASAWMAPSPTTGSPPLASGTTPAMDTAPKARPAESEQKPGIPMNILDEPDVIGKRTAKRVVKIAAEPIPAEDLEARRRASSIAAAKTEHPSILKKSKEVMSAPSIKDGLTKRDEDRAARFADLEARSRASSIAAAKVEHPSILRKRKEVIAAYKEWLWDFNCCPSKL